MKSLFKKNYRVDYFVQAGERSANWPNRRLARLYKTMLSEVGVNATILKREWERDGLPFLRKETQVH